MSGAAETVSDHAGPQQIPIAGIGASAGGLEAFRQFVAAVPPNTGIGFVLIQHLDPTQASLTAELLAKHTSMPVLQVSSSTRVRADHVYVIPPNKFMSIKGGVLRLFDPPTPRGARLPIDYFLRSLAEDRAESSIGVVLSGTGTDGTLGLKEIRAAGGITIAQRPDTAQYDGMPRSAIDGGCVDHVLSPAEMPAALVKYVRFAPLKHPVLEDPAMAFKPDHLQTLVALLHTRAHFDFSGYKKGTLVRRVQRRMGLRYLADMPKYLQVLRTQPEEVTALCKDLLINVTRFFRDAPAWQYLQKEILPRIVASKQEGAVVRVWVAGCASGEEAYTMGMLLTEYLESRRKKCTLHLFASDVDAHALETARAGIYPESIAADVSRERLRRFFVKGEHTYTVKKELRDCIVFAQQNLISDAPFSRLDLISCRNVLIYLLPPAQKRILTLLHFALLEHGYLMLSGAESVSPHDDLFETVSKKWRIYRRVGPARHDRLPRPADPVSATQPRTALASPPPAPGSANLTQHIQRLLLNRFAPATAVIDRKYRVVHFSGPIGDYLQHPPGEPTTDLISLVRNGLQSKLRAAIHRAMRERRPVQIAGLSLHHGQRSPATSITVDPLTSYRGMEGLLLVSFTREASPEPAAAPALIPTDPQDNESALQQLEYELKATREDLQSTIEEHETSNEELKASNEEVLSVNEELQSTNEELETSKEELQSLNEELSTVNNQLQSKVEELESSNNDLGNLLANTSIPTIFLDTHLRIKRFTPASAGPLHLIPGDLGRPMKDISGKLSGKDLLTDAQRVLEHLQPQERELESEDGQYFLRRILPYRTQDNRIQGVVVTFIDITQRKVAEETTRFLAAVLKDSNDAVIVQDLEGRIAAWNSGAQAMYGYTEAEALAMNIRQLAPPGMAAEELDPRRILGNRERKAIETQRLTKDGRTLDVWLTPTILADADGQPTRIATTERDITERRRSEEELRASVEVHRSFFELGAVGLVYVNPDGKLALVNDEFCRIAGYSRQELTGMPVLDLTHPEDRAADRKIYSQYLSGQQATYRAEKRYRRKDGSERWVAVSARMLFHADGRPRYSIGVVEDITDRKAAQEELRRMNETLEGRVRQRTEELEQQIAERKQLIKQMKLYQRDLRSLANEILVVEEKERRRLAVDLHDGLGQLLTLIQVKLAGIHEGPDPGSSDRVAEIRQLVDQALRASSTLTFELSPPVLHELGFVPAVHWLAEDIQRRYQLQVRVQEGGSALPRLGTVTVVLFRCLRELLINVAKHAHASHAVVRFSRPKDALALAVEDDGRGFDADFAPGRVLGEPGRGGFGLFSIRERLEHLGGHMEIHSARGKGTVVNLTVPLPSAIPANPEKSP